MFPIQDFYHFHNNSATFFNAEQKRAQADFQLPLHPKYS
jgi:hypothetical protein